MLASLLYPYDADAGKLMEGWLKELEDSYHIRRYAVDGHTYLEVLNWLNHQKIDRPSISKLPPFDESSRVLAKSSVGREGKGRDQGRDMDHRAETVGRVEPEMLARQVPINLGLAAGMGPGSLFDALYEVAKIEKGAGRILEDVAAEMECAWKGYQQEKPKLRIQWGAVKFFGEGHWREKPEDWPHKEKSRQEEISAWRAPDDID
jgi:hypothetical protein